MFVYISMCPYLCPPTHTTSPSLSLLKEVMEGALKLLSYSDPQYVNVDQNVLQLREKLNEVHCVLGKSLLFLLLLHPSPTYILYHTHPTPTEHPPNTHLPPHTHLTPT
jgi:hypothetical protein